jgi:hypothetical protein
VITNLAGLPTGSYVRDKHVAALRESGLTDETIRTSRVYSATDRQMRALLKWPCGPGLVFDYGDGYWRAKLDVPQADGKQYRAPANQPGRLYVPPMFDKGILKDPSLPLIITEGEKKALAGVQAGLPCVSFPGVYNWLFHGEPIPDLDVIAWAGRLVVIAFDSDAAYNPQVMTAEAWFADEIRGRGAWVWRLRFPEPSGKKVGMDDALFQLTVDGVFSLPVAPVPPLVRVGKGYGEEKQPLVKKHVSRNDNLEPSKFASTSERSAGYLWSLWGGKGPLKFDYLIHSPFDPNKRRAGTKFVRVFGEVRAKVEGIPRNWPLCVFWYHALSKGVKVGNRRYKARRIPESWLPIWEGLLQIASGQLECPYRSTLDGDPGALADAWAQSCWIRERWQRRQGYNAGLSMFDPSMFSALLQWPKSRVVRAWDEVDCSGAVRRGGVGMSLYYRGDEDLWIDADVERSLCQAV